MPLTLGMLAPKLVYSATFLSGAAATVSGSTWSRSSVSIGTADSRRLIVVAGSSYRGSANTWTINSATIGGVTATINVQQSINASSSNNLAWIIAAVVPTGTTATIDVVHSVAGSESYMSVYSLIGFSATAAATASGSTASTTISNVANGCLVGSLGNSGDTTAVTWTGITETNDVDNGAARASSAMTYPVSAGSLTINGQGAASSGNSYVASCFQPV